MSQELLNETTEETQSVSEPLSESVSESLPPASEVLDDADIHSADASNANVMQSALQNASPEDSGNSPEGVANTSEEPAEDPETFPRSYVEKLRKEAAGHRDRAKRADDFAQRLHTALVEATGRLADPADLPFEESHLDDAQALTTAIEALLADKPHLASRKPFGNIGQGVAPVSNDVSLGGILRAGAM